VADAQDCNDIAERGGWPLGAAGDLHLPPTHVTNSLAALGEKLFADAGLSGNGSISCATCHRPAAAFSDDKPFSQGVGGARTRRNTPIIANRIFAREQFWDGRASSLEQQVLGPLLSPTEMAGDPAAIVKYLSGHPYYKRAFVDVFGRSPNLEDVASAIATFERTLFLSDSPFDRFEWGGDLDAISEAAIRGMGLFRGKARCSMCHAGPHLTDELYHDIGLPRSSDYGRRDVTGSPEDSHKFKTPTLRSVAVTAPYMHDGSIATLPEVIAFYNRGGTPGAHKDKEIQPLRLTSQEERDLLAFLLALTSPVVKVSAEEIESRRASPSNPGVLMASPQTVDAPAARLETSTINVTVSCTAEIEAIHFPELPVTKNADHCGRVLTDTRLMVRDCKVQNVAVYVNRFATHSSVAPPRRELRLRAAHCNFEPRVQIARVGDTLLVGNEDPIIHNPHAWLKNTTVFNMMLRDPSSVHRRIIGATGVYSIKCDTHEWMHAYVVVVPGDVAGVTGADGTVALSGLPSGEHELVVWHEVLGEQRSTITVKASAEQQISILFSALPRPAMAVK
jgi:cytochrome c peroxidase